MLSIPVQAASKPPLLPGPQHRPRPAATVLSSARRGRCRDSTGGGGGGVTSVLCPPLATPWTAVLQAPLSMGFSRQEYWGGLPFPSPGNLPNPGMGPRSPALQVDSTKLRGKPVGGTGFFPCWGLHSLLWCLAGVQDVVSGIPVGWDGVVSAFCRDCLTYDMVQSQ